MYPNTRKLSAAYTFFHHINLTTVQRGAVQSMGTEKENIASQQDLSSITVSAAPLGIGILF